MKKKYYCTHNLEFWNKIKDKEYFIGDKKYYMFPKAYKWLMKQMEQRLPNYKKEDGLIWLWPFRPDLRGIGFGEPKTKCVLLELTIDDTNILQSDYSAWHCILNNGPILTDEEAEKAENYDKYDNNDKLKKSTWERVFDIDFCKEHGYCDGKWIQCTTGKVPMYNVKLVKQFTAR